MKGLKIERVRSLEQQLRWRAEVLKEVFGITPMRPYSRHAPSITTTIRPTART